MPTSGGILGFNQIIPVYADRSFIDNTLTMSKYLSFSENIVVANKYLTGFDQPKLSTMYVDGSQLLRKRHKNLIKLLNNRKIC